VKHDQKEADLEKFLEKEKERELARAERASGEGAAGQEIMWDATEAAATLGSAKDRKEGATNIIASDAFAHLTDDIQAPIPKPEVDVEPAEGLVGEFDADTAIAIGMIEGEANPSDPDGFVGEGAARRPSMEEDEDVFGGGGGKPPDDDDTPVDVSEVGEPDVGDTSKKKRKKKKDKGSSSSAAKPAAKKPAAKKAKRSWFKKKPE